MHRYNCKQNFSILAALPSNKERWWHSLGKSIATGRDSKLLPHILPVSALQSGFGPERFGAGALAAGSVLGLLTAGFSIICEDGCVEE